MMLKVGITGGIGSGKTTACKVFEVLGVPVFYADAAAKKVMVTDPELRRGIVATFGAPAYTATGEVDRKYLGGIVFNDSVALGKLNALVHPAVFRAFDEWAAEQDQARYVVKESAILFESGASRLCHRSVLITSPEALKIARIMKRDHIDEAAVRARMDKQMSDDEKRALADYLLVNDEVQLLIPQIVALHRQLLLLANDY